MWVMIAVLVAAIVAIGIFFVAQHKAVAPTVSTATVPVDPQNATYIIDGQSVALVNGKAQVSAAPGSAEQVTTSIFGEPAVGDLNGDGKADAAVILVQAPGGSGTFYYVAVALDVASGTEGTNAIFLGDRIAPQNISIANGKILVDYADRNPGEPMSTPPSRGVSAYFIYKDGVLAVASSS